MKAISPTLTAFLANNSSFFMAELYTLTLQDGTVLTYTDADIPIQYFIAAHATYFNPLGGMRLKRDRVRTILGTQVDSLDITFFPDTTDLINGQLFTAAVIAGIIDGAWVTVDRAFMSSWTNAGVVGTVNVFAGRVSDAVVGRTTVKLTIKSPFELLNVNVPVNLYQPGCAHNLFDAGCGLNPGVFEVDGVVTGTGQTPSRITTNLTTQGAGYFDLGYLTFLTGACAGQSRSIQTYTNGPFVFGYPFAATPTAGDTFKAFPGCDHSQSTCVSKFNNIVHFRGFPYVPLPETAA